MTSRLYTALRPLAGAALALAVLAGAGCAGPAAQEQAAIAAAPLVVAHRGASALRPEHTLEAYRQAIDDGADFIEPDLVMTKDGVLVARHENEISGTTDVAARPEYAARRATRTIDGVPVTGWFTEDFTLAEIKTLRARERIPANRPASAAHDGRYQVPTLQEIIDLAAAGGRGGRVIGLYPETKHPSYFRTIGLPLEPALVAQLERNGYAGRGAPVMIQSFEVANLKALRSMTRLRLVQLIGNPNDLPAMNGTPRNKPYDFVATGDARTYADLVTPAGLKEIAGYADIVAPHKDLVIPRNAARNLGAPTGLVAQAHAAGLQVHAWTFRPENPFLPSALRSANPASPSERGDSVAEIGAFLRAGVDGIFTDDPALGRAAVAAQRRR